VWCLFCSRGVVTDDRAPHVAHHNVVVLRTPDPATMDELLSRTDVRGLVWKRLDETRALVDVERLALVRKRLTEQGRAPRFETELA